MRLARVFGIVGHSGMGKTTLLERLIPAIAARGQVVSLIKHSHKDIDIDRPGKDSHRLREAGCKEVLLLGNQRWALMHELRGAPEPTLDELLDQMGSTDLVLIEGFKEGHFPKLEVWREEVGQPMLWPERPGIVAMAGDRRPGSAQHQGLRWLPLSDIGAIADLVLEHAAARDSRP